MTTRVVNIRKHTPTPGDVYIGRAGKGQDGYFGNTVAHGRRCPVCGAIHARRDPAILDCYREYLGERLARDPVFRDRVKALAGRTLTCFCKPAPCHGDILAEAADLYAGIWSSTDGQPPLAKPTDCQHNPALLVEMKGGVVCLRCDAERLYGPGAQVFACRSSDLSPAPLPSVDTETTGGPAPTTGET